MTLPAEGAGLPFVHQACLYRSDDAFLSTAVPFVEDGLSREEPVLAAVRTANFPLLRDALGQSASRVELVDSRAFGPRPPERLACFDQYWTQNAVDDRWVRVLAEPDWADRSPSEVIAWKVMEHTLNAVLAHTSVWMICPYDTRAVGTDVLAAARRAHPQLDQGVGMQPSSAYVDPGTGDTVVEDLELPAPTHPPVLLGFHLGRLADVRDTVTAFAADVGLPPGRTGDLVLAVQQLVCNAIEHGGGHGVLCMWTRRDEVLAEVTDSTEDRAAWRPVSPVAGAAPTSAKGRGRGLWLVRRLCDRVTISSHGGTTSVRLHVLMTVR